MAKILMNIYASGKSPNQKRWVRLIMMKEQIMIILCKISGIVKEQWQGGMYNIFLMGRQIAGAVITVENDAGSLK